MGTFFSLTPPAEGASSWKLKPLLFFDSAAEGRCPVGLVFGPDGALYGATADAVFRLQRRAGGGWRKTILKNFSGAAPDPVSLDGGLIFGPDGEIYGTSYGGGSANKGTVYRLSPPTRRSQQWTADVLYSFQGGADGSGPSSVIRHQDGSLLGTYPGDDLNAGNIFRLAPSGETWTHSIVQAFEFNGADGSHPFGGLTWGPDGIVYAATYIGGLFSAGVLYSLTPPVTPGGQWTYAVLAHLDVRKGKNPFSPLAVGPDLSLYGGAKAGPNLVGAVFRLKQGP
jgi:uncharacterized repeat protein (TIGR03803 family)